MDIALKEKILPYLSRVRDEFAIPMIYVTHNMSEVLALADLILMIRQGKLLAQGVSKDVLRSPDTIRVLNCYGEDRGAEFYVRSTASAVDRLKLVEDNPVFLIMKTHSSRIL